jgi:hypothetical protein
MTPSQERRVLFAALGYAEAESSYVSARLGPGETIEWTEENDG